MLLLLLAWILPGVTQRLPKTSCHLTKPDEKKGFYRPGDLLVGGNLPLGSHSYTKIEDFHKLAPLQTSHMPMSVLKNYQHILALVFAITEIKKDPTLLPNTTLGFCIYEHGDLARYMHLNSLSLLSTRGRRVPNYKCDRRDKLLSIIGGIDAKSSREIAS
ncbi:hypothetical protein EYD10_18301 [Varanus komodoensis]|nr:hypothetical protein EYD10_18301 [Varanus komodoensis]